MLDYKQQLVTALSAILPTYYEAFVKKASLPCISYTETFNSATMDGEVSRAGRVEFTIKLYTETVQDQVTYQEQIDTALLTLGLHRTYSLEMFDGKELIKVLKYTGTTIEHN